MEATFVRSMYKNYENKIRDISIATTELLSIMYILIA